MQILFCVSDSDLNPMIQVFCCVTAYIPPDVYIIYGDSILNPTLFVEQFIRPRS